ncbi:hypothetical protein, partial [Thermodesulfobium sp.]
PTPESVATSPADFRLTSSGAAARPVRAKELSRLKKESDNTLMELFNNLKGEQKKEGQKFWWMRFFSK